MFNKNKLFQLGLFVVSVSGENQIGESKICPPVCGWTLLRRGLKVGGVGPTGVNDIAVDPEGLVTVALNLI